MSRAMLDKALTPSESENTFPGRLAISKYCAFIPALFAASWAARPMTCWPFQMMIFSMLCFKAYECNPSDMASKSRHASSREKSPLRTSMQFLPVSVISAVGNIPLDLYFLDRCFPGYPLSLARIIDSGSELAKNI